MTADRQQKLYGFLLIILVIGLLAVQYFMQLGFGSDVDDLASIKGVVQTEKRAVDSKRTLVNQYKALQGIISNTSKFDKRFPENAILLYASIDQIMRGNSIELVNQSQNANAGPNQDIRLQISFKGGYYSFLKALAALRDSDYAMRIAELRIISESPGAVSGTLVIVSRANG